MNWQKEGWKGRCMCSSWIGGIEGGGTQKVACHSAGDET